MKKLKIGGIVLKNPLFLAPMINVTDMAYRLICRECGCAMAYTEMIHVQSIIHANKSVKLKMMSIPKDKPLGIQITGSNVKDFSKIIPELRKYDLVDLNCGCPGHLTVDNLSGAYLMKDPDKISSIVKVLKDNGLNVTAKIRLGFNKNNVIEMARKIESAGADALTVHTRLATHTGGTKADWNWFPKIRNEIGIPLIGNGDVFAPKDAEKVLEVADGVMIARGAIGNPLIFRQIVDYFKTGKINEVGFKDNLKLYLKYLKLSKKYNLFRMDKAKYIGGKFLRGFVDAPKTREAFMRVKSYEGLGGFVRKLI